MKLAAFAPLLTATAAQTFPVTVPNFDHEVTLDADPTPAISPDVNQTELVLVAAYAASLRGQSLEGKEIQGKTIAPWY